eukprot:7269659-Prymnesium_polylepis.1
MSDLLSGLVKQRLHGSIPPFIPRCDMAFSSPALHVPVPSTFHHFHSVSVTAAGHNTDDSICLFVRQIFAVSRPHHDRGPRTQGSQLQIIDYRQP